MKPSYRNKLNTDICSPRRGTATANDNRFAFQVRIIQNLNRKIKDIHVQMDDMSIMELMFPSDQPIFQIRKSFLRFVIFDPNRKCLFCSDDYHQLSSPGHGCINQVPLQKHIMLDQNGDNDCWIFGALGFVDRYRIR